MELPGFPPAPITVPAAPVAPTIVPVQETGGLYERAMLAHLHIGLWSGMKHDKELAREVARQHGSDAKMHRHTKYLVARERIEKLSQCAASWREHHRAMTLAWADDRGPRVLDGRAYEQWMSTMQCDENAFIDLKRDVLRDYPEAIQEGNRLLNGAFRKADYPTLAQLDGRITFRYEVYAFPEIRNDFRVAMGEDAFRRARARDAEMMGQFKAEVATRIKEAVRHMADKLEVYRPATHVTKAEGVFRDTLVENVRELIGMLPLLNVTNDVEIAGIAARMQSELLNYSAQTLRDSTQARITTAAAAAGILADVDAALKNMGQFFA